MSNRMGRFALGFVCPVAGSVKNTFAVTTEESDPFCVIDCGLDVTDIDSATSDGPLSAGASVWWTVHAVPSRAAATKVVRRFMTLCRVPKVGKVDLDLTGHAHGIADQVVSVKRDRRDGRDHGRRRLELHERR